MLNRREFVKSSMAALAGLFAVLIPVKALTKSKEPRKISTSTDGKALPELDEEMLLRYCDEMQAERKEYEKMWAELRVEFVPKSEPSGHMSLLTFKGVTVPQVPYLGKIDA